MTELWKSSLINWLFPLIIILSSSSSALCNHPQLRQTFMEAVGEHFEFVRDELEGQSEMRRTPGKYWLVHVKPKRSGHFALKYTYKYHDKFYEEGEHTLYIRVGGKICHRFPQPQRGLSGVCLGDTIIIPIRLQFASNHAFNLKYTYAEPQSIEQERKLSNHHFDQVESKPPSDPLANTPLEKHLKYLGTRRTEMLHRNGGATITYSAIFEAKSAGRFNLGLTSISGENASNEPPGIPSAAGSTPIIIVEPGTPITSLLWKEDTINYADERRFSSHSGNNFLTTLLMLQPGDVFSLEYFTSVQGKNFEKKIVLAGAEKLDLNIRPVAYKFPFSLKKDWGYNDWIINYLPAGD